MNPTTIAAPTIDPQVLDPLAAMTAATLPASLAAALVSIAGIWLAASLLMSMLYPLYANRLAAIQPAQRAWLLRAIALTPIALALLAWIELFVMPGRIVPHHCHHADCSPHDPHIHPTLMTVAVLLLITLLPVALLALKTVWSTLALARDWKRLSAPADRYRYLDCTQPIACIVGLFKPTIYFSRGFIANLSPAAVNVVIAHEQAHAARYDNLWAALVRVFSLAWIGRGRLAFDLELAQEQACDLRAAGQIGDALAVAETLLQCQRLSQMPQVACAFVRGQLDARVQLLLEPRYTTLSPLTMVRVGSLAVLSMAALVIPLHYVIEFL